MTTAEIRNALEAEGFDRTYIVGVHNRPELRVVSGYKLPADPAQHEGKVVWVNVKTGAVEHVTHSIGDVMTVTTYEAGKVTTERTRRSV